MGFFLSTNNHCLGVDIGTSGIKMVELKKEGGRARLVSYGFSENKIKQEASDWKINIKSTAKIINKIYNDSKMTGRSAVASLPTFSVFSSIISLSNVSDKDIPSAVHWEAKKVIPLPLEEMILDWKVIKEDSAKPEEQKKNITKIFLTGAPRTLIKRYLDIFKEAQINLLSLETETFSLIRAFLGNDKSAVMIAEIGANTTDLVIVDSGIPILSRSIDIGGATITRAISNNLNIGAERAEQFKYDLGISSMGKEENIIPKTIIEALAPIVNEIKYTLNLFQSKSEKDIEKIILSGGSSLLINFSNYLSKILDKNINVGDPWARVSYPVDLRPTLDEIGPRMSVAIGLAMREID
jgi:type IV pilus assembly protein PilM